MSWSPDLFIGEFRPWPDAVDVVRGTYDDTRRYVPEEERDMYRDLVDCMVHPEVSDQLYAENVKLQDENARLRSCLSDDAENARMIIAENEKLRGLVAELWEGYNDPRCKDCPLKDKPACADCHICAREAAVVDRMRELGIEVDE